MDFFKSLIFKFALFVMVFYIINSFLERESWIKEFGVFKYSLIFKSISIIFFLLLFVFPLYILSSGIYQNNILIVLLVIIFGGISSISTLFEAFGVKGSYDEESVTLKTPWGGTKTKSLKELEYIEFKSISKVWKLKFYDDTIINLSVYLGGVGNFIEFVQDAILNCYEYDEEN